MDSSDPSKPQYAQMMLACGSRHAVTWTSYGELSPLDIFYRSTIETLEIRAKVAEAKLKEAEERERHLRVRLEGGFGGVSRGETGAPGGLGNFAESESGIGDVVAREIRKDQYIRDTEELRRRLTEKVNENQKTISISREKSSRLIELLKEVKEEQHKYEKQHDGLRENLETLDARIQDAQEAEDKTLVLQIKQEKLDKQALQSELLRRAELRCLVSAPCSPPR